jgi:hypothetical protein
MYSLAQDKLEVDFLNLCNGKVVPARNAIKTTAKIMQAMTQDGYVPNTQILKTEDSLCRAGYLFFLASVLSQKKCYQQLSDIVDRLIIKCEKIPESDYRPFFPGTPKSIGKTNNEIALLFKLTSGFMLLEIKEAMEQLTKK